MFADVIALRYGYMDCFMLENDILMSLPLRKTIFIARLASCDSG